MRVGQEKILSLLKSFFMWLSAPSRLCWRLGNAFPDELSNDWEEPETKYWRPFFYKLMKTRDFLFKNVVYWLFVIVWFVVCMVSWLWPLILGELYKNLLDWISANEI